MGLLVQFLLGALVRHQHAGLACPKFPNCLSEFLPIPFTGATFLAFTHRWWGVLLIGVFVHIFSTSRKESKHLARVGSFLFILTFVQVLLGISTVHSGLGTVLRATHAAAGYGLWAVLFYMTLRAGALQGLWNKTNASSS